MSVLSGKDFKAKYGTVFFKALKRDLVHFGIQYKLGLNEDVEEFNPHGDSEKGGLYFTDIKNILKCIKCGPLLGIIEIPDDAKVYVHSHKFKCDKFVLKEIISDELEILKIYKTSREHGSPLNTFTFAITAQHGYLQILQWLREVECPWDEQTFIMAAIGGDIEVLQWLDQNECPHPFSNIPCMASIYWGTNSSKVLKWLSSNGYCYCDYDDHHDD